MGVCLAASGGRLLADYPMDTRPQERDSDPHTTHNTPTTTTNARILQCAAGAGGEVVREGSE